MSCRFSSPAIRDSEAQCTRTLTYLLPVAAHRAEDSPVEKAESFGECFSNVTEANEEDRDTSEGVDNGDELGNIFIVLEMIIRPSSYFSPLSFRGLVSVPNSGYQDDGVEQRTGESPLHLLLVFAPIPPLHLHRLDDLFLELLHLGLHHPGPVVPVKDHRRQGQVPDLVAQHHSVVPHLPLDLQLVVPLQVLEGETSEDAVSADEGEEADVRGEECDGSSDGKETPGEERLLLLLLLRGDGPRALRPGV